MTGLVRVLGEKENGNNTFDCTIPALVERGGELSNFLDDFNKISHL
jgi:hypothetical protein